MNKIYIIFFLFLFSVLGTVAQTSPTPYQKKQFELTKKWYLYLTGSNFSMAEDVVWSVLMEGNSLSEIYLAAAMLEYSSTHSTAQCQATFSKMKNDFEAAEKLKNSVDIKRERELAIKRKVEQEKAEFMKTDLYKLETEIRKQFSSWSAKDEFEKVSVYDDRLKRFSKTQFNNICINVISAKIKEKSQYFKLQEKSYDSEKELFYITTSLGNIKSTDTIHISIEDAPTYKNSSRLTTEENDWGMSKNDLYPIVYTLNGHVINVINVPDKNTISIPFDDLQLDNPYLKGYVFRFSNISEIISEIKESELSLLNNDIDSLFNEYNRILSTNIFNINKMKLNVPNHITEAEYEIRKIEYEKKIKALTKNYTNITDYLFFNHCLDSIFNKANNELLSNPYNINHKELYIEHQMSYLNDELAQKELYQKKQEQVISCFLHTTDSIESSLKNTDYKKYISIFYSLNPDRKNSADILYQDCRCLYNREHFDSLFVEHLIISCPCRNDAYNEYGHLYESKTEFDNTFNQGEEVFQKETEKRQVFFVLTSNKDALKSMNFKDELKYFTDTLVKNYSDITNSNTLYISCKDDVCRLNKLLFATIYIYYNKAGFQSILDVVFDTNDEIKTEWNENSPYFKDKEDLYLSYISNNYKKTLKNRKSMMDN